MTHSPEPWKVGEYRELAAVVDADDCCVASCKGECDDAAGILDADIERIVACVNFCRGVPTGILNDIVRDSDAAATAKPLDEIREHILRWHELNPHLWSRQ